jgi:hypothetical protein
VDELQPEQTPTYAENALTFIVDQETCAVSWGERLDARSGLRSLDEVVEPPPEPPGGWGEGVVKVEGRPVRPINRRPTVRPLLTAHLPRTAVSHRASHLRARRGSSRQRRTRITRRARGPSRDGLSDSAEGDGEGPPPPAPGDVELSHFCDDRAAVDGQGPGVAR